jgi:2,3-bisphosphoglycerate-independent phosphoglycerate mutase
MRNLLVLIDGLADTPQTNLGGKTPLEAANTPVLDKLGMAGRVGLLRTVPKGQAPETLAALFTILGYPPGPYLTGRGYYEALAAGIALGEGQWAFRLQLISEKAGVLVDPRGGGISAEEGRELLAVLEAQAPHDHVRYVAGHRHNHLLVVEGTSFAGGATHSPFGLTGQPLAQSQPSGPGSEVLLKLMEEASTVLSRHEVNRAREKKKLNPANAIWPWSGGTLVEAPGFKKTFGLEAALVSYSPMFRGVAVATGIKILTPGNAPERMGDPSGRMAKVEQDGVEKRTSETEEIKRVLESVRSALPDTGLVIAHFTHPDEHSHEGDAQAKIKSIELIDRYFFKPLAKDLEKSADTRLTVVPTLMSRVETRQHDEQPVPFLMWGQGVDNSEQLTFTEANAVGSRLKIEDGTRLIDFIMNGL